MRVESDLVQTNLANNNLSLAQKHANKAAALLTPSITIEIAAENQKSITNLQNSVTQLNSSIRNKASPIDIMMIVHTQIHPNLLEDLTYSCGNKVHQLTYVPYPYFFAMVISKHIMLSQHLTYS